MTHTLPEVTHEHHERLLREVDRMPVIGDAFLTAASDEVKRAVTETGAFLSQVLVPHIDAAEHALYPELERMFQNRHSMAPMRREHEEVRRLVAAFTHLSEQVVDGQVAVGRRLALRRVLFQLYALVKVHLAEEEMYVRIVEHGVTSDVGDMLAAAMEHPGIRAG